tara:strand:+ start:3280 stop:4071 length:792 start_codon:yes stop_codon:yes gene_type:complete
MKKYIMEHYNIALLIITTSNKRDEWQSIKDSYLYNMTLKSFLATQSKEHKYKLYIGIDEDDRIFDKQYEQDIILNFSKVFSNIEFEFVVYDNDKVKKGHATLMWNILFEQAYKEDFDYFYQCGDDIVFKTYGWVDDSIKILKEHNDLGLTGPINNNNRILTQSFVSRKHMEIFGWYFPVEIKNWCCDDWYNMVYYPEYLYPLHNHFAENNGGAPRYNINNNPNFSGNNQKIFEKNTHKLREDTLDMAKRHKILIMKYLNKQKI